MSEEKMEWESAEERFVEGYKGFDLSVIYVLTAIFAVLLWMFVTVVIGTGWFMMIVWAVVIAVLAVIVAQVLKKMML